MGSLRELGGIPGFSWRLFQDSFPLALGMVDASVATTQWILLKDSGGILGSQPSSSDEFEGILQESLV